MDPKTALLDVIEDKETRAAISAGWELGAGLAPSIPGGDSLRAELLKAAKALSREINLDINAVYGAALLSMALGPAGSRP